MSKLGYWERRNRLMAPSLELGAAGTIGSIEEFGGRDGEINPLPRGIYVLDVRVQKKVNGGGCVVCVGIMFNSLGRLGNFRSF
jgi:hypothetical protein